MAYSISVKLKPRSKELRKFLRQNDFYIYSRDHLGRLVSNYDDQVDEPNKWLHYECMRSGQLNPPQAVIKRIDEARILGVVIEYTITAN